MGDGKGDTAFALIFLALVPIGIFGVGLGGTLHIAWLGWIGGIALIFVCSVICLGTAFGRKSR